MRMKNDLFIFERWEITWKIKKTCWSDRFTMLMGERLKRRLKLIKKLLKLPIFFLSTSPRASQWILSFFFWLLEQKRNMSTVESFKRY